MTLLVVALDAAAAARCAKRAALKGKWLAVTPDNYQTVLPRLAAPREQLMWDDTLPWGNWSLPSDMLQTIRACMNRAQP